MRVGLQVVCVSVADFIRARGTNMMKLVLLVVAVEGQYVSRVDPLPIYFYEDLGSTWITSYDIEMLNTAPITQVTPYVVQVPAADELSVRLSWLHSSSLIACYVDLLDGFKDSFEYLATGEMKTIFLQDVGFYARWGGQTNFSKLHTGGRVGRRIVFGEDDELQLHLTAAEGQGVFAIHLFALGDNGESPMLL
jgi:hypothetical protein